MPTPIAPRPKIQRQERLSTISPERTSPRPPPTPNTAETTPTATLTFSRGNSSLMIEKLSGKTAPPAPWRMRQAISEEMSHAKAAPMLPRKKMPSEMTSSRSLPYWSPSLPSTGVATDAERRKPVSSHVAQVVVVPNSCWSVGSAGRIIVCCSAKAIPANVRTARVTL